MHLQRTACKFNWSPSCWNLQWCASAVKAYSSWSPVKHRVFFEYVADGGDQSLHFAYRSLSAREHFKIPCHGRKLVNWSRTWNERCILNIWKRKFYIKTLAPLIGCTLESWNDIVITSYDGNSRHATIVILHLMDKDLLHSSCFERCSKKIHYGIVQNSLNAEGLCP